MQPWRQCKTKPCSASFPKMCEKQLSCELDLRPPPLSSTSPPPSPTPPPPPPPHHKAVLIYNTLYRWIVNLGHDSTRLLVEYMTFGHKPAAVLLPILHQAPCTEHIPRADYSFHVTPLIWSHIIVNLFFAGWWIKKLSISYCPNQCSVTKRRKINIFYSILF